MRRINTGLSREAGWTALCFSGFFAPALADIDPG